MADVSELVEQLRSFRTRKQAMDQLIDMGEAAVGPLLEALDSRSEGMRWAAMRSLGELGDERAVGPIIDRLDEPRDRDAACWSLGKLTGQDLGGDAEAWREWRRKGQAAPEETAAAAPAAEMDDESLFAEAVKGLAASVQTVGSSRIVHMSLEGERHQVVRVVMGAKDFEGEAMVLVYSECAPADPKSFEFALKLNISLPYAALALREVDGEQRLVMFNSMLRKGLTPLALRKSIVAISEKADRVEKRLTGQDQR